MSKPTIDILLQVAEHSDKHKIIHAIKALGYEYIPQPDNPPPHMMFAKGYSQEGFVGQAFHIHVRYPGDWDELWFRDYLLHHPDIVKDYEKLKARLAIQYKHDRDAYTDAKTEFITKVMGMARE